MFISATRHIDKIYNRTSPMNIPGCTKKIAYKSRKILPIIHLLIFCMELHGIYMCILRLFQSRT